MKKIMKKSLAFVLAFVLVFSVIGILPAAAENVQAASSVRWNRFNDYVVTYKPGSYSRRSSVPLSIVGCSKKSQIKKLKSSRPSVCKVSAKDGYIRVEYGKKSGSSTITCTVKGVKLSHKFTVKKYTNPLSKFKVGKTNYTSKFAKYNFYTGKRFKKQTLSLKAKKGWKISDVYLYNGKSTKHYAVNKSSFSKKISLTKKYSSIQVTMYNSKYKLREFLLLSLK